MQKHTHAYIAEAAGEGETEDRSTSSRSRSRSRSSRSSRSRSRSRSNSRSRSTCRSARKQTQQLCFCSFRLMILGVRGPPGGSLEEGTEKAVKSLCRKPTFGSLFSVIVVPRTDFWGFLWCLFVCSFLASLLMPSQDLDIPVSSSSLLLLCSDIQFYSTITFSNTVFASCPCKTHVSSTNHPLFMDSILPKSLFFFSSHVIC